MKSCNHTMCSVRVLGIWTKLLCELRLGPVHHCMMVTCAIDRSLFRHPCHEHHSCACLEGTCWRVLTDILVLSKRGAERITGSESLQCLPRARCSSPHWLSRHHRFPKWGPSSHIVQSHFETELTSSWVAERQAPHYVKVKASGLISF